MAPVMAPLVARLRVPIVYALIAPLFAAFAIIVPWSVYSLAFNPSLTNLIVCLALWSTGVAVVYLVGLLPGVVGVAMFAAWLRFRPPGDTTLHRGIVCGVMCVLTVASCLTSPEAILTSAEVTEDVLVCCYAAAVAGAASAWLWDRKALMRGR